MARLSRSAAVVVACTVFVLFTSARAQQRGTEADEDRLPDGNRFGLHGYGVMNYHGFRWDTDPGRRNAIDMERLVLYPSVRLSGTILAKAELEFEHGGTGTTMEFDRFEEFGEYEAEIEKGGEVVLDQLHVQISLAPAANLRIGRIKLPVGLIASRHEPGEYFTTGRSEMETALIPAPWYENGIEFYGGVLDNSIRFSIDVVNGLDATGFSSAHWIVGGHQTRFEMVNAQNLAIAAGIDVDFSPSATAGVSGYYGNSSENRPKPDMSASARVAVGEAHAAWEGMGFRVRAMGLYGTLENADLVSQANRNISNNLNVKRTPVGSAAAGYFVEAGFDVLRLWDVRHWELTPFLRWESYDSMAKVDGDIFDNPRWERKVFTFGVNCKPIDDLVLKAELSRRRLGIPDLNTEQTFSLGVGFEFD
jgi:hypothetical protein